MNKSEDSTPEVKDEALSRALSSVHKREMTFGGFNAEKRTAELSFSSEIEYERFPGFIEVLSHNEGAVDLARMNSGASVLFNHDHDKVVGVVESAKIGGDKKGRAVVRFGSSDFANQIWKDVQDGILRNVSVGYRIKEMNLTQTRDDGTKVYTAASWEPFEVSIVTVPADQTVGVGRGLQADTKPTTPLNSHPIITMSEEIKKPIADPLATERERTRSILAAGKEYKADDLAAEFVSNGKSAEEFRSELLAIVHKRNTKVVEASKPLGLSEKEVRSFSFINLLRALSNPTDARSREQAAYEMEVCQAAADKSHRATRGTVIPVDVLSNPLMRSDAIVSIKDGTGYAGTGGNTVATTLSSSFIEILRKRTVAMQLGSQLGGLVGNLDIPKQLKGTSGYWIGEDAAAPTDDVTFGLVELRGKTVAAKSEITRKMLMQSSIDVEAFVRMNLAKGLAETIDLAFFYGSGTGAEPKGIKNVSGINGFAWGANNAPTFAELVQMETEIGNDNASTNGAAYVFNTALRGYLKTTKKFSTSGSDATLLEPGNTVNGYRSEVSNQIAAGDVFFGDFSQVIVGLWGGLEITVDPFTGSDKGRLRIVSMQDVDFAVGQPSSLCLAQND
jgi:HK97 family phage major capsid protein/HK97 family phage prohead protease